MRTIVVTGGSTHIGRATAEAFAAQGGSVFIASRDLDQCTAVAEEITRNHGSCEGIACDVTDPASVSSLVRQVLERTGRLDVMVCNAGGSVTTKPFPDSDPDLVEQTIRVNLVGSHHCAQQAAGPMITAGKGAIILMASTFGILASDPNLYSGISGFTPTGPAYHAAKGGIIQLTRSLAARLGPCGVRVNCISPGVVPSDEVPSELLKRFIARTPLRRVGTVEDVANAVLFLAGDEASFVTGHNLVVDGGWVSQ